MEWRDIQVQTGYTGRRVTSTRSSLWGPRESTYFQVRHGGVQLFFKNGLLWRVVRFELATQNKCSAVVAVVKALVGWATTVKKLTSRLPELSLKTVSTMFMRQVHALRSYYVRCDGSKNG